MFVSSYNTYISSSAADKVKTKESEVVTKSQSTDFKEVLTAKNSSVGNSSPIDYIAKSKTFNNKQEVQYQQESLERGTSPELEQIKKSTTDFGNISTLQSAKKAYSDNSTFYSYIKTPQSSLNQTPRVDKKLPTDIQQQNLKQEMVNTYIQNDNYFKLTA